jgi:hypothetical protein
MAIVTYTDAHGTGLWEDDLNWSHPHSVAPHTPGPADDVYIPPSMTVEMDGSRGPDEVHTIHVNTGAVLEIINQSAINHSSPAIFDGGGSNLGTINIALQSYVEIGGAFKNQGVIAVGEGGATDSAHADYLVLSKAPLSGGGAVTLSDGWIEGALTNAGNTISGFGFLGNGFTQGQSFALINHGTIDATGVNVNGFAQDLVIQAGSTVVRNDGLLEATNPTKGAVTGGLALFQDVINNIGGVIEANGAHTHVDLTATTVRGGALETLAGGQITFDSTSLLDGTGTHTVTIDGALNVKNGATLNVAGNLSLSAKSIVSLNSTGAPALLVVAASGLNLSGGGQVVLGGSLADTILAVDAGGVLSIADVTIKGGGLIGGNDANGNGHLTLVNQQDGVIDATSATQALVIRTAATVQNHGLMEATGAGTLLVDLNTIDDSAGGTIAARGNANVTLQNSTVIGGVLVTSDAGLIKATADDAIDGRTSAVQNRGRIVVVGGSSLTTEGSIANTGTITVGANDGGAAFLRIGAGTTLSGGGHVALVKGVNGSAVIGASSTTGLTNVDNTISGDGSLGAGQLTLINEAHGVINANASGILEINTKTQAAGGSVTNNGLIEATGAGGLVLHFDTVDQTGGGRLFAGAGAVLTAQDSLIKGGLLSTAGTGEIDVRGVTTFDGTTSAVRNQGKLVVLDGANGVIDGSMINAGTILVGDNIAGPAFLSFGAATSLTGGGVIRLSGGDVSAAGLDNVDNTISGSGTLGGSILNEVGGVINANAAAALVLQAGSGSVTNNGLIEATGKGGVTIFASTVDGSGGGKILAQNGHAVTLDEAVLVGGVLQSTGAGAIDLVNFNTLDGRTSAVTNTGQIKMLDGGDLYLAGAITNSGTITLDSGATNANSFLRIAEATRLTGGGTLRLGDGAGQRIVLGPSPTTTLTNVDNTIVGSGQLSANTLRLVNQAGGTIDADGSHALTIESGAGQTATNADVNTGLMEATGAGGLEITLTTINQSGGGTILAAAGSKVTLGLSEIIGGTLETAGSGVIELDGLNLLDGSHSAVANLGSLNVTDNAILEAAGALRNAGVIRLKGSAQATTFLAIDTVLSGGGELKLGNSLQNLIEGGTASQSLTNVDNTISGSGLLGNGRMVLINQAAGTIDGLGSVGLIIDTGSQVVRNAGLIEAGAGGSVTIDSAVNNTGVIEANGGTMTINAAVTGAGKMLVNGGTLDLALASVGAAVGFAGTSGVLKLEQSQTFHGSVAGLSKSAAGSLDLADIEFTGAGEAKFVEFPAKTAGMLTVTDGTRTAKIKLLGDYSGIAFTAKSDNHGGTIVTAGAAPATAPFVQAIASFATSAPPPGVMRSAPDAAGSLPFTSLGRAVTAHGG